MNRADVDNVIARWARVGVLFGARLARVSPDLERLLLDSARVAAGNARVFYLAVAWVSRYGNFVARHRLKHLVESELSAEHQPTLGALLALAVRHGGSRELLIAAEACVSAREARPLFEVQSGSPGLERVAKDRASVEGRRWNVWVPDQPVKVDALRPARWIIERNRGYLDRIVRKGDLRCSILLTLRHDAAGGEVASEVALAKLCSANRIAVRHALDDLEREGYALRHQEAGSRNVRIVCSASQPTAAA